MCTKLKTDSLSETIAKYEQLELESNEGFSIYDFSIYDFD